MISELGGRGFECIGERERGERIVIQGIEGRN